MARGLIVLTVLTLVAVSVVPIGTPEGPTVERSLALRGALGAIGPLPAGTVSNGAEPDIHVTRDGSVILVGDVTGLYRSLNGGATWTKAPNPFLGGLFADGWPIAEDDAGRLYAADTQGQIVGVASSANKGQSWDVVSEIVAVGTIVDRPWLAARGNGEVVLIVNSDRGEECYRSTDGGATWLDVSVMTNNGPNAGSAVFDSRGRLWWTNGGQWWRWTDPCLSNPQPVDHPNGGAQILTQADVDSSNRPYTALPSSGNGQMMLHSLGAAGAQKSLAVSPATLKSNTFGALDVDNETGDVVVGWYGSTTPGDPSSSSYSGSWHVYVARVQNFWSATPTITVTQVTPAGTPNHVGGFCMSGIGCTTGTADRDLLDYFGVAFGPDDTIHVAYGHDGATSNAEVRYAHVI